MAGRPGAGACLLCCPAGDGSRYLHRLVACGWRAAALPLMRIDSGGLQHAQGPRSPARLPPHTLAQRQRRACCRGMLADVSRRKGLHASRRVGLMAHAPPPLPPLPPLQVPNFAAACGTHRCFVGASRWSQACWYLYQTVGAQVCPIRCPATRGTHGEEELASGGVPPR